MGQVCGDSVVATALLDRLLHHAVVVQMEGASYRPDPTRIPVASTSARAFQPGRRRLRNAAADGPKNRSLHRCTRWLPNPPGGDVRSAPPGKLDRH
ncbi:MAG: ATP-binding protein [Pseudomonadota bacterium]